MGFRLRTTAFQEGGLIPRKFTCDGEDVSPALEWAEPPAGTKSFSLIADDPDAPSGTWVHWVLYDLPGGASRLQEGAAKDPRLPDGAHQGQNDFGKIGYNGPCPPKGSPHRYFFKLYALDRKLSLQAGATKAQLERAMKGHILAEAETVGLFSH